MIAKKKKNSSQILLFEHNLRCTVRANAKALIVKLASNEF